MLRVVETAGGSPHAAFTIVNVLLLAATAALLARRISTTAAVLLAAGPILWWIDKPHPDVFTFCTITAGIALMGHAPWWSLMLFGLPWLALNPSP